MSINTMVLQTNFIPNILNSDYEFNRFEKKRLQDTVSVLELSSHHTPYFGWENVLDPFLEAIFQKFPKRVFNIYGFISSPSWKQNNRINRYLRLGKFLVKTCGIKPFDFMFEKEIIIDNEIIFWGVLEFNEENALELLRILSTLENGILFSIEKALKADLSSLGDDLAQLISIKNKSGTNYLNVVDVTNVILNKNGSVLFPYAWEETGSYHIDILELGKDAK